MSSSKHRNATLAAGATGVPQATFTASPERVALALALCPGVERDNGAPGMGINTLWYGVPGVGKTARLRRAMRGVGLHLETVLANLREPADFLGLPMQGEGGVTRYSPPEWAVRVVEADTALVFLDEIDTAPTAVQNALLRVVLDGVVGDIQLPSTTAFQAARNGRSVAGRWDLDAALANRFLHLPWPDPDAAQGAAYLMGRRITRSAITHSADVPAGAQVSVATVLDDVWRRFDGVYDRHVARMAAFRTRFPHLYSDMPDPESPAAGGPWPSPRSWDLGLLALCAAELHGLPESDAEILLAGAVGVGAAVEYAAFAADIDIPDPGALLDGALTASSDDGVRVRLAGGGEWRHAPARADRTMAALNAATRHVLGAQYEGKAADVKTAKARAGALLRLLHGCLLNGAAESAVLSAQTIVAAEGVRSKLMALPEFTSLFAALEPFTSSTRVA
jgi:MoxR-like ATPase